MLVAGLLLPAFTPASSSISGPATLVSCSESGCPPRRDASVLLAAARSSGIRFEENLGQWPAEVTHAAQAPGMRTFLTTEGPVVVLADPARPEDADTRSPRVPGPSVLGPSLGPGPDEPPASPPTVLRFVFEDTSATRMVENGRQLDGISNHYLGNDPARGAEGVRSFDRVTHRGVWPGIDVAYYTSAEGELEYDFLVAPGADPSMIRFAVAGADDVEVGPTGALFVRAGERTVVHHAPIMYQEVEGARVGVDGGFLVSEGAVVHFDVGSYDAGRTVVIDPVIVYSTYLGGSDDDYGERVAVDSLGDAIVTGYTRSANFPTFNATQSSHAGGYVDAFVTKLTSDGSRIFSTYLGGSDFDLGLWVAVDGQREPVIVGRTGSNDFPVLRASQPMHGGGTYDAFVVKLTPTGYVSYSTFLGGWGPETGASIAVDTSGNVYVTGETWSTNFPTSGPSQPTLSSGQDAFVTKYTAAGGLLFSTFLGGSSGDSGRAIAVDSQGNFVVTGVTQSADFPTANPGQSGRSGYRDAFVTRFTPTGTPSFSTYLGGGGDEFGYGVAVGSLGEVVVTGITSSTDFPTLMATQPKNAGAWDAFVTKLAPTGMLLFSTYLGGSDHEFNYAYFSGGVALDPADDIVVTGTTGSVDFPTVNPIQPACGRSYDAFAAKLTRLGSLVFSTCLGGHSGEGGSVGVAVDNQGNAILAGTTFSNNFPTRNASQPAGAGLYDAFVTKLAGLSTGSTLASGIVRASSFTVQPPASNPSPATIPVGGITVELFQDGAAPEAVPLGRTVTGPDGKFAMQVNAPGPGAFYLKGSSTSPWSSVESPSGSVYSVESYRSQWIAGPWELDVTDANGVPDDAAAFDIQSAITQGARYLLSQGLVTDSELRSVVAQWPSDTSASEFEIGKEAAFKSGVMKIARGDEHDPSMVLHEYGHFVMWSFFAPAFFSTGTHQWDKEDTAELAWAEGFASFFSAAVRGSEWFSDVRTPLYVDHVNFENPAQSNPPFNYPKTRRSELAVATFLWDIYDAGSTAESWDRAQAGFGPIWQVLRDAERQGGTTTASQCEDATFGLVCKGFFEKWQARYGPTAFCAGDIARNDGIAPGAPPCPTGGPADLLVRRSRDITFTVEQDALSGELCTYTISARVENGGGLAGTAAWTMRLRNAVSGEVVLDRAGSTPAISGGALAPVVLVTGWKPPTMTCNALGRLDGSSYQAVVSVTTGSIVRTSSSCAWGPSSGYNRAPGSDESCGP
ncbi:MAG: DUF7948 domain-containing protein [Methanobacteriota archaeon]